jgi:hypothetical protein
MPTWDDLNATRISPIVAWTDNGPDSLTLWHWCSSAADWTSTPVETDAVTSRSPLTIKDLTDWSCCGLRGHIRNGRWTPA